MGLFKHLYILSLQESFMDSLPKPEKTAAIFGEKPPSYHVQSSHLGKTKSLEQEYHDHALKIQIAYRKRLAHKRFTIKPREFYKQISQEIADKDKRELAQSMFGVTVAGLPTNSPMFRRKAQRYHREGDLTSEAKAIMEKETPGMSQSIDKKFGTYLPISVLHNSPLDEILKKFCNPKDYQIITSFALLVN